MSKVHYETAGAGEAVVLISGLGGLGSFWKPVVPLLARRFRVFTFDHPGVGRSAAVAQQTVPGIADAVLELLEREEVRTAHIVGHSTGSLVAQTLALDHRERCERIVLSGGWARPDRRFRDLFEFRKYLLERVGTGAYAALSRLGGYDGQWYDEHLATPGPADFDAPSDIDIPTVLARIDMLLDYERADELASLKKEVLVVGANDDFIIPLYHSKDLARRIPGSRLTQQGGGHFFPQVNPNGFSMLVTYFLGRK